MIMPTTDQNMMVGQLATVRKLGSGKSIRSKQIKLLMLGTGTVHLQFHAGLMNIVRTVSLLPQKLEAAVSVMKST